jgi:gluconokinase
MADRFIAVDLGTSAARALLFDLSARPLQVARRAYPLLTPHPGWSEQDPEVVVGAAAACLREVAACVGSHDTILGVTFSSQMYSVLALDPAGRPVTNSLTWNDCRSAGIADGLRANAEFRALVAPTGCPISAIFPLYKILWLKEQLPHRVAYRFVSIKDYVIHRLTGRLIADWSTASASGLLDVTTRGWHEGVLAFAGLERAANLPEVVSPRTVIRDGASQVGALGIPPGTPIVLGGGDGPLASLGIGAVAPGAVAINVGTSAAYRVTVDTPTIDPAGRLWTFVADEGLWVTGGITGGGLVYDWLLHTCFGHHAGVPADQLHQHVDGLARSVQPGAAGLLFLPYLAGQQSPDWDAQQRGGFVGLGVEHGPGHLARAVLEGLAFSLYRIAQAAAPALRSQPGRIYMSGGITRSDLWLQLAADLFGCEVLALENTEGSATGSLLLGMLALDLLATPADFAAPAAAYRVVTANEANFRLYQGIFGRFEDALRRLNT